MTMITAFTILLVAGILVFEVRRHLRSRRVGVTALIRFTGPPQTAEKVREVVRLLAEAVAVFDADYRQTTEVDGTTIQGRILEVSTPLIEGMPKEIPPDWVTYECLFRFTGSRCAARRDAAWAYITRNLRGMNTKDSQISIEGHPAQPDSNF